MPDPFMQHFFEIRLGGCYQICKPLGAGTFGKVYLGRNVDSGDEVAIKLEHCSVDRSLLSQEVEIYDDLKGRPGIPRVYWHGYNCEYRAMAFQLLGPNLEDLFRYCDKKFSLKTTLMLMDQLLRRIEDLHTVGYLHRDIKPENFLLGTGSQGNVVFMTDLGLATSWDDSRTPTVHLTPTEPPRLDLVGTCSFAAINAHLDAVSSRRDDLESLGYMALYFLRGSLPWQGLRADSRKERHRLVLERKQAIPIAELCDGLPAEFETYMRYVRGLGDRDEPDYAYLRRLFKRLFHREKFEHDYVYDWTIREFQRLSELGQQDLVSEESDHVLDTLPLRGGAGKNGRKAEQKTGNKAK